MNFKNVECEVEEPLDPFGSFANALRLTTEGTEVLLDFCVYSHTENKARVVSRVRCARGFLSTLVCKISNALSPPDKKSGSCLFVMPPLREEV